MRRTFLAFAAIVTAAAGAFAVIGPAQAGDVVVREIEAPRNVSIGEAQKLVAAALKQEKVQLPSVVAVASDIGELPSSAQLDALLAGKSVDDFVLYRAVSGPSADITVGDLVKGTPLPAFVSYRANWPGRTTEVAVTCPIAGEGMCRLTISIVPIGGW